jgi:hypothetical protein
MIMNRSTPKRNQKTALKWVVFILILLPFSIFAQSSGSSEGVLIPFVRLTSSDSEKNYFSADLTVLPDFFERAYMLELIYSDPELVVNNSNISGSSLEILSNKKNDQEKVIISMGIYRDKAITAGKTLTESQKKELLEKYKKFR